MYKIRPLSAAAFSPHFSHRASFSEVYFQPSDRVNCGKAHQVGLPAEVHQEKSPEERNSIVSHLITPSEHARQIGCSLNGRIPLHQPRRNGSCQSSTFRPKPSFPGVEARAGIELLAVEAVLRLEAGRRSVKWGGECGESFLEQDSGLETRKAILSDRPSWLRFWGVKRPTLRQLRLLRLRQRLQR